MWVVHRGLIPLQALLHAKWAAYCDALPPPPNLILSGRPCTVPRESRGIFMSIVSLRRSYCSWCCVCHPVAVGDEVEMRWRCVGDASEMRRS